MNKKSIYLFFILSLLFTVTSRSQNAEPCATDNVYRASIIKHPELLKIEDEANASILRAQTNALFNKTGTIRYVPVVFHIIHENGTENISQEQIMDEIRILNEDYRKKAGTNGFNTDALGADMEIEFRLAQYDPNGNKHDGINRIYSTKTVNAGDNVKSLSYWDSKKYLNVWVVKTIDSTMAGGMGIVLGYAQFPWQLSTQPSTDGIIVRADQIGVIGTGMLTQAGRTLTHEIGHWLGLYHPFQGGCTGETSGTCSYAGDKVCDTPPVASATSGCPNSQNSCTNDVPDLPDMVKNYMDYGDGKCMNIFTLGQLSRVNASFQYRPTIFGTSPDFTQSIAYSGINSADGSYLPVTAAAIKAPYFYGFENSSLTADGWKLNNFNNANNGWQQNTLASYDGGASILFRNATINSLMNAHDGFQSPEIDLTTLSTPFLTFYYAYAQKDLTTKDSLIVRISNDFGMHETILFAKRGSDLATAAAQTDEYIPVHQDWKSVSLDLSAYSTYTHARFRFEFVNRRGNNAYVDNLNVSNSATGVEDALKENIGFAFAPNPVNNTAKISFKLNESQSVRISIYDLFGREVKIVQNGALPSGANEINFSREGLKNGLYLLSFSINGKSFSHKLLIN